MSKSSRERAAETVKALRDLQPGKDLTAWAALELALAVSFELRDQVTELQQELSKGAAVREYGQLREDGELLDENSVLERRAVAVMKYRKYTEQLRDSYEIDPARVDAVMAELRSA